jgi:hypothetical protein
MSTIACWRTLTREQRAATLDAYDDLLAAAQQACREGWFSYERDPLCSEARRLGVVLWPALADRITIEARRTTAAP